MGLSAPIPLQNPSLPTLVSKQFEQLQFSSFPTSRSSHWPRLGFTGEILYKSFHLKNIPICKKVPRCNLYPPTRGSRGVSSPNPPTNDNNIRYEIMTLPQFYTLVHIVCSNETTISKYKNSVKNVWKICLKVEWLPIELEQLSFRTS